MHRAKLVLPACALALAALGSHNALAAPIPAPWQLNNIGVWESPGTASVDFRGLWTLRTQNGDVLASVDSTLFVSQPLSGDGSVVALLLGQEGGADPLARAGVMIREDASEGSRNVFLSMTSGNGLALTTRRIANYFTEDLGSGARYGTRQFPLWLRLQRQGDDFTPFVSSDGYGWTQLRAPIRLAGFRKDALAGLAASTVFSGPMTAVFNNPTIAPGQVSPAVQTIVSDARVLLTWPPVAGATGYVVRRSAPNTPGFAADMLTPAPLKSNSFTDAGLANGRPFRYLVSPILTEGGQAVEGWATAVTAVPTTTPLNLLATDIDVESSRLTGTIQYDPATSLYQIRGSGSDIWDTSDHFFFASRPTDGDFQITAQIRERPDRKGGLMIRESLDGPSRMVLLAGTAASGVVYQYRGWTGATTAWSGQPAVSARDYTGSIWVRLVRKGATVTPLVSQDGKTFVPAGAPRTFDPPLAKTLYAGYAVTSQNAARLGASTFSDLTITQ